VVVHDACGYTTDLLDTFCTHFVDVLSLERAVCLREAKKILLEDVVLFCNIDLLLLHEVIPPRSGMSCFNT